MREPELDMVFMMQLMNVYNCRILFLPCFQFFSNSLYCSNNIAANLPEGKLKPGDLLKDIIFSHKPCLLHRSQYFISFLNTSAYRANGSDIYDLNYYT